jgi:flagellar motility protein MotE (MotC chaperone)
VSNLERKYRKYEKTCGMISNIKHQKLPSFPDLFGESRKKEVDSLVKPENDTRKSCSKTTGNYQVKKKGYKGYLLTFLFLTSLLIPAYTYAQEDLIVTLKKKNAELLEKEESLKKEEERLLALKKDISEMMDKYSKLLSDLENAIKKIETIKNERLEHLIKTYESMSPDKAAQQLASMDEQTAVNILSGMKSKKAALILANMDIKKATILSEALYNPVKKFPAR